jgi:hemolysin III
LIVGVLKLLMYKATESNESLCLAEQGCEDAKFLDKNGAYYWAERIPWYPEGCFGPYRVKDGYSRRELLADGIVHIIGIMGGCFAFGMLISHISQDEVDPQIAIAVIVYGFSLLLMLCCSAVFNGLAWSSHIVELQLADHTGILFLIAGTYTPCMALACCPLVLAFVWLVLAVSWTAKASKSKADTIALHVTCFLLMGWCCVLVFGNLMSTLSDWAVAMAVLGGVIYSAGLIPWAMNQIEFHNAIWHIFVLAASACFYSIIFFEVSQPKQWRAVPPGTCQGRLG